MTYDLDPDAGPTPLRLTHGQDRDQHRRCGGAMRTFGIGSGTTLIALWSAVGCGGSELASQDGDAGPLARCGGNCSPAQVAASCSATCDKVARTGCSVAADCPMSCAALPSMTPSCAAVADEFIRCVESLQPTCSDSGTAQFLGCDTQQQALRACVADSGSSGMTATTGNGPPGGPCGDVPASVCPDIPRPVAGAGACSGGGSGGPNGTTTSQTSCQDSAGNVWQAECAGSTCTCAYNGGQACTCTMTGSAGSCSSCCPGTG